jgi:hypothetical protein
MPSWPTTDFPFFNMKQLMDPFIKAKQTLKKQSITAEPIAAISLVWQISC